MQKEMLIRLVTGAQKGDSTAMDQLFSAFYNDVYYFALKTVKDSDIACDITQETFLEIIRTIGNLQEPAAFVTWMKRITYHQCTRYFSKKKEVLVEEDEDGNTIFDTLADESEGSIPSEIYEKEEFRNTILGIINELSEQQRSAVMMYYFDELTVAQIAQIQGVSEGTVKSRLNYARKAVKGSVEDYEKKHNIKLYSFSFLPLFLLFFGKKEMPKSQADQVQAAVSQAARKNTASQAGRNAVKGGKYAAVAGAKAIPMVVKIIACVVAVALALAAGVLLMRSSGGDQPQSPVVEEPKLPQITETSDDPYEEELPEEEPELVHNQMSGDVRLWRENVISLTFTNKPVPEGVETMDLSAADPEQVLAWLEVDPEQEDAFHVYITATDGGVIYAPLDCTDFLREFPDLVTVNFDNFDTSRTQVMTGFFQDCPSLESLNLSRWDTARVTDMSAMFWNCNALEQVDVSGFDTAAVTNMSMMFDNCNALKQLDVSGFDTANVTDMSLMFYGCHVLEELDVSGFDTANVTQMGSMFADCFALKYVDVSGFDTSEITGMDAMFYRCYELADLDVSGFDTSNVTTLSSMFDCCKNLTHLDVSGWDTGMVNDMSQTFGNCILLRSLDVSGWDTSAVTDMMNMFTDCRSLDGLDVSRWNTSSVTDMYGMFHYCRSLTSLDVSNWDTSNVTDMDEMFALCDSLGYLAVSNWNTANVTTMENIFAQCDCLAAPDISGWVIPAGSDLGLE
jgi:RNA polymerase sigma factor (sigma-70 family)